NVDVFREDLDDGFDEGPSAIVDLGIDAFVVDLLMNDLTGVLKEIQLLFLRDRRVRLDRVGEREIKSDIGSEVSESKEEIVDALRLERADSIRGKIFALMGDFHELLLSELDENVKMNLGARDKILDSELTKGRRVFAMHARSGCAT